ncbi:hypothetical protein EKO04_006435 [Ascochyta lentis]|uniref:Uncharacterized protein n=1 Tax=Ascochyta lentis TaxID=205686 RepID=A0A8H7J3I2_9PLEO|nr:hypothetical protein EKO04_006435 [Ascochyta lentis]
MDNTKPLRHCQEAFNNIISQCIQNSHTWGDGWSLDNESYNITNSVYPANALGPNDDGGVPLSVSSSTTAAPTTTSSPAIALGPQTGIETGMFATTTSSINGLTANSFTSTFANGHPTVLPIWFVGLGIGIMVIPAAGVIPGGVIPPPPGFPPLTIDSNRGLQTVTSDDNPKTSTSSLSSSSFCPDCTQSAFPIDKPDCQDASEEVKPTCRV